MLDLATGDHTNRATTSSDCTGIDHNLIIWGPSAGLKALPKEFLEGLNRFDKFDRLTSLSLGLDALQPGHTNGNLRRADRFDFCRTQIVDTVLRSVARCNISSLRSLTLLNFPCRPQHALLATPHFLSLLRQLQELTICVSLWSEEEEPIQVWDCMKVFFQEFSRTWLQPLSRLTTLDLSMKGYYWGYSPRVDFRRTTLPHIRKLRIAYFTFSHNWQLDWLSSLQALENLVLDSCAIITHVFSHHHLDDEGYPRNETPASVDQAVASMLAQYPVYLYRTRWSDYFTRLATTLIHLKGFLALNDSLKSVAERQDVSPASWFRMVQTQYLCYVHGNWLTTDSLIQRQVITGAFTPREQLQADREALKELLAAVAKRNNVRV